MTNTKTRPIVFSGKSIGSIQALLKTQTRRVIVPQPWLLDACAVPVWIWHGKDPLFDNLSDLVPLCPFGIPGDLLWVKETWRIASLMYDDAPVVQYKADGVELEAVSIDGPNGWGEDKYLDWCRRQWGHMAKDCAKAGIEADAEGIFHWTKETNPNRWRSPRFMPRWASRLTLEIADVWAERLQDIAPRDCFAEGVRGLLPPFDEGSLSDTEKIIRDFAGLLHWGFMVSWDELNAKRGFEWFVNPLVWAIEFKLPERK